MHTFLLIMVMALVTIALRALPFILFSKNTPEPILYLGEVLPYAVMAMLVIYCLKGISFTEGTHGIPEILAVLAVAGLHKWKHNTLLSILLGTVFYMVLIHVL